MSDSHKEKMELLDKQKEVITSAFERNKNYTNIIIVAGYAAYFSAAHYLMDKVEKSTFGIMIVAIIISITVFIIFEIIKIVYTSVKLRNDAEILSQNDQISDRVRKLLGQQRIINNAQLKMFNMWPYFIIPVLVSAFVGWSVLIISYLGLALGGS